MPESNRPLDRTHRPGARRRGAQQQCRGQRPVGRRQASTRPGREHINQALAVLHTMREPDEAMAAAGDEEIWSRMVDAAIAQRVDPAEPQPS